jgi:hypothetical protein
MEIHFDDITRTLAKPFDGFPTTRAGPIHDVNGGTWNTDIVVQKSEDVVSCLATFNFFASCLEKGWSR